jgi:Putative Actinobacterial Holin-X, holin superfamily III
MASLGTNGSAQRTEREESLGLLVRQLSDQSTRLARLEVELAKSELQRKGKQLGIGAGAFGGAGLFALFAFAALTAAFILGLGEAVDGWLAALIVTAVYGAVAGIMALVGRRRIEAGTPPAPERAIESTKADIDTAKRSAKEKEVRA